MLTTEEAKKLWDLVKPLETAMLVTSEQDLMQARPMQLVQDKFDGTFYFFTEVPTEKTREVSQHQNICLTFSCPKSQSYVSVSGKASVIRDNELIEKFWSPFIAAWFPQGKEDPSVALMKIEAYQAEYWQGKGSKITQLFKYANAYVSGHRPDIGKHEQF
ncbi:MAG: pyridoxamine 5'-phosphate oxidase family protein [Tatlockia sp.]|nr:pyridoxamine 5'-phosphate oxidase family protein [Tatlockia sp.]